MKTRSSLPDDATAWLRTAFRGINRALTSKISLIPTVHEPSLDLSLIEFVSRLSVPIRFRSGAQLVLETHFLGGFPMFRSWEIADIGFLVMFRRAGRLYRSKVALLQSKRLYPRELRRLTRYSMDQIIGFGRLHMDDKTFAGVSKPRVFRFSETSQYLALVKDDDQFKAIAKYQADTKAPVYYLLYNPVTLPFSAKLPARSTEPRLPITRVGARVLPYEAATKALRPLASGRAPTYRDIASADGPFATPTHRAGWSLEHFVVDELLSCTEGYATSLRDDETLISVFFRRTAPISAAIAITIDTPQEIPLIQGADRTGRLTTG